MKITAFFSLLGVTGLLAACAQPPGPMTINPEPMYHKLGGGFCVDGYVYVPGTAPQSDLCIPEDDCILQSNLTSDTCLPPPDRDPDDNGRDDPRDSTGRPADA